MAKKRTNTRTTTGNDKITVEISVRDLKGNNTRTTTKTSTGKKKRRMR